MEGVREEGTISEKLGIDEWREHEINQWCRLHGLMAFTETNYHMSHAIEDVKEQFETENERALAWFYLGQSQAVYGRLCRKMKEEK